MPIAAAHNVPTASTFPLAPLLPGLEPGVYLATAEAGAPGPDAPKASQWFVVSDLGLTSFFGDDGLTVFARSLTSALPLAGVELHLLARNGKELAQLRTGTDGIARFKPAVTHQGGDTAAQALFAYGGTGEFSFLDLAAPGVDLSDRGAVGRTSPGPLDVFLATERAVYRPGETVSLTSLLRDNAARAVIGRSWLLTLVRPDGMVVDSRDVADAGAGGGTASFTLLPNCPPGAWSVTAHIGADGPVIGHTEFAVHELLPPRLEFEVTAPGAALSPGHGGSLGIAARSLFGAPAAHLPGELSMTVRVAETPFSSHAGYRFGLAQEKFAPVHTVLPGFTTGGDGRAEAELPELKAPDSSHPLEAVIRGTIFDIGGRAISRDLTLPIRHQPFLIGLHPRFEDDAVPEGATAAFDVITLAADGSPIDKADLSYELYEEESEFRWFETAGRWDYETVIHDHRLTGGTISVAKDKPAGIEEPLHAGRYRLEVFDSKSGVASSMRFAAGWWAAPGTANRPDKVDVSVMRAWNQEGAQNQEGALARVHIRPPYDSQVVIAIADRSVRKIITRAIPAAGAFLDIPVSPDWSAGVTIIATAYAAVESARVTAPRRAIGVGWLPAVPQSRTLRVGIETPAATEPLRTLKVPVTVRNADGALLPGGTSAFLTLSAVDEAVLQVVEQPAPDPVAYYLGQRRLGVELRDVYGRLLDPVRADTAAAHGAPPERKHFHPVPGLPERDAPVVTLFSGVVQVGADGVAQVPLDIPDFDGRLRLLALAWTDTGIGRAEGTLAVQPRIRADLALPRFLAPGDRAAIDIALSGPTGAAGEYQVALSTEGGIEITDGRFTASVKKGRRVAVSRQLVATHPGPAALRVEISGPDGFRMVRNRPIRIRPPDRPVWRHRAVPLEPNQTLAAPDGLFDGLRPDSLNAAITVGAQPLLDLPGLVMTVDQPLHGNLEIVASGILRLIAGGDLPVTLGFETPEVLRARVQAAVDRVVGQQHEDGGFSAWSLKEDDDPVLTPFIADTLERAGAAGYRVPEAATRRVRDWLKRQIENGWAEDRDLPSRAYATYLLARAKGLDSGAVHYFHETFGAKLTAPLARAEIAAAFALVGDPQHAEELFGQVAADMLAESAARPSLRDVAGTVALAAESAALPHDRLAALVDRAAALSAGPDLWYGPGDLAWMALAARAVIAHAAPSDDGVQITVGEETVAAPPLFKRFTPAAPADIRNTGPVAITQILSGVGLPAEPPGATSQGFTLSRALFNLEGKPLKPDAIRQNELIVVILEGHAAESSRQRVVIRDLLPAGLEAETVRFADSPQLGDLSWLGGLSLARHADYRHDRFLAVLDLEEGHPDFRVVYLARAVSQGDFAQPGATVEAAADPRRLARTAPARLLIH